MESSTTRTMAVTKPWSRELPGYLLSLFFRSKPQITEINSLTTWLGKSLPASHNKSCPISECFASLMYTWMSVFQKRKSLLNYTLTANPSDFVFPRNKKPLSPAFGMQNLRPNLSALTSINLPLLLSVPLV